MKRDHALDTLRGLLLLIIAINHFGGPIPTLTYQPLGYMTGAEGFVMISGIAIGMLWRKFQLSGRTDFAAWCWQRATVIYFSHVAVVLAILALAQAGGPWTAFCLKNMPELAHGSWQKIPAALALLYQPRYNAILPLYCLLFAMAPMLLSAVQRFGPGRVLMASIAGWALVQGFWPSGEIHKISAAAGWRLGIKNPCSWQLLFVVGLVGGTTPGWYLKHLKRLQGAGTFVILLLAIGLKITLCLHTGIPGVSNFSAAINGGPLGWLRLQNTLMLVYLVWRCLQHLPPVRPNAIAFLGRHSLPVFVFQIVALYLLRPLFDESRDPAWWVATGGLLLAVSQFIPAILSARWRNWRQPDPLPAMDGKSI